MMRMLIRSSRQNSRLFISPFSYRVEECLFIGDTLLADYEGPRQFGMSAYHLVRGTPSTGHSINSLADVLTTVQ